MSEQKAKSLERDPKNRFYEVRGASFLDRFTRATRDEPFLVRIMSVIWVSGPVTLIALTLAYYVREKSLPEVNFIIYLMLFSFITGIVSIVTGLFKKAYYDQKEKEVHKKLLKVVSFIPELILSIRNIYLRSLDKENREITSAYYLIQMPGLASGAIECAIYDIFKDDNLAKQFKKMEIYKRRGLYARVVDYADYIKSEYQGKIDTIKDSHQMLHDHLTRRLNGYAPSFNKGKRRKPNFLLNIQNAIDEENNELFDLQDAEEFLKLLLELLIGREFVVFGWFINGSEKIRGVFERYEKLLQVRRRKIAKYRIAIKRRKNKKTYKKATLASIQETLIHLDKMKSKSKEAFERANTQNEKLSIVFEKSKVYLSDPERIELIEKLEDRLPIIKSIVAIRKINETIEEDEDTKQELMEELDLKDFCLKVFFELNRYIDFTDLALIESIQSVRSINISGADIFSTRKSRIGWLDTLLDELDENLNPVALETCQRIVNIIDGPLHPRNIQDILKNFNLSEQSLTELAPEDLTERHPFFS